MANIKELLSGMATGDVKEYTPEEIKEMADEYNTLESSKGNDEELNSLKEQLKKEQEEHQKLKDRVVDHLFHGDGKGHESPADDKTKDDKTKKDENLSFKDLVKPDYR